MKEETKTSFLKSLVLENPIFVLCLGMCTTLAVTKTFEDAYIMGILVLIVLLITNIIISLIAKYISKYLRVPIFLIITSIIVTIIEIIIHNYTPNLYNELGIYLPLIAVNCIILDRATSYASSNTVNKSIIDALKSGLGFALFISLFGLIREFLGSNTITLMDKISDATGYFSKYIILPTNNIFPNNLFTTPAGAFILLGLIIGTIHLITKVGDKK
jgi:electron transport complex protein RnfE